MARVIRSLRHPDSRWVRIPVGVLLILAGLIAPLVPLLGVWMIPIGLLLLASDVPFLRRPMAYFTMWSAEKWANLKRWWVRRGQR